MADEKRDTGTLGARARTRETRERIFEAARTVFARRGYLEATLEEIAREAGVGKSSLFRHVDSKAELLLESLLRQDEDATPRIREVFQREATAEARLRGLAAELLDFWTSHPAYRPMFWALDNQDLIGALPPALVERVTRTWQPSLQAVVAVVQGGIDSGEFRPCDPHVTAHVIWNLGNLMLELKFSPERQRLLGVPLERMFEEAIELVISGLRRA